MSKKEKTQAELDAEAKAKADAEAEDQDDDSDEDEDESNNDSNSDEDEDSDEDIDNEIDYKSIAEKEREARKKAEKALADQAFKDRRNKRKNQDEEHEDDDDSYDDEDDDEDKPITQKQLKAILAKNSQETENRILENQIKKIVKDIASSEDEAEAIIETYKSRTFPSYLSLEDRLDEVKAIVNRKTERSKNIELARALKNKEGMSRDRAGTHRDPMEGSAPKVEKSLQSSLQRAGFEYDSKLKVYKKLLPSKKYLYKDPKTKRTWVK